MTLPKIFHKEDPAIWAIKTRLVGGSAQKIKQLDWLFTLGLRRPWLANISSSTTSSFMSSKGYSFDIWLGSTCLFWVPVKSWFLLAVLSCRVSDISLYEFWQGDQNEEEGRNKLLIREQPKREKQEDLTKPAEFDVRLSKLASARIGSRANWRPRRCECSYLCYHIPLGLPFGGGSQGIPAAAPESAGFIEGSTLFSIWFLIFSRPCSSFSRSWILRFLVSISPLRMVIYSRSSLFFLVDCSKTY